MQIVSDNTYNNSLQYYNNRWISNTQRPVFDVKVSNSDFTNTIDDDDTGNGDNEDVMHDDSDYDGSDFDNDELYEDEEEYSDDDTARHLGRALGNSVWIAIIGIVFLWIPKFLKLTGNSAQIVRIVGIVFIVWAVISFFSML